MKVFFKALGVLLASENLVSVIFVLFAVIFFTDSQKCQKLTYLEIFEQDVYQREDVHVLY